MGLVSDSGWNRYSVGYHSADGFKSYNYPFTAQSYGLPLAEGDVLGVGYRPRTGAVFFTRNGKKFEDAYVGLTKHNLFPTVAADGAASIHVNLGQAGFVFIEANVKKWGLAPTIGTLAPPPAYGSERGSILLETATGPSTPSNQFPHSHQMQSQHQHQNQNQNHAPQHQRQRSADAAAVAALAPPTEDAGSSSSGRSRTSSHRRVPSATNVPVRPSPLRQTMTRQRTGSYTGSTTSNGSSPMSIPGTVSPEHDDPEQYSDDEHLPHNPPTPGQLDISLRAMSPFSQRIALEEYQNPSTSSSSSPRDSSLAPTSSTPPYDHALAAQTVAPHVQGDVSPPLYQLIDSNQYPAGVAEAMLEAIPEEQLAALFAAAHVQPGRGHPNASDISTTGSFRSGTGSYEGRNDNESSAGTGLGLRGILSWSRRTSQDQSNDASSRV